MKKFICFLMSIFIFLTTLTPVYASTNTFERREDDNYGVHKKWDITSKNRSNVLNTPLVDAKEKIYDYADILTDDEEKILYDEMQEFISKTKMEIVFVTIDKSYYSDKFHEDYAADFYDYNDFGIDTDNYDGVLLLRNAYQADPYFNIYTFGKAQLYFPYERCESLLDNIYDDFKSHNYLSGYRKAINDLNGYYKSGIPLKYKNYYLDDMGFLQKGYSFPFVAAFFISGILTAIIMIVLINKNKMVKKATRADEYLDSNSIGYSKRCDEFITSHTTSYTTSSSSGGGGGHSHSGSSGGGHGGGGGRHG